MQLTIDPDTLRPIVKQVLKEALAEIEAIKTTLPPERLAYSEAEAAGLLGMQRHQLRDERRRGRITASAGPGRKVLYQRGDLEAYLASTRTEATAIR